MITIVSILLYAVSVFIGSMLGVAVSKKDEPQFILFGLTSIFFFLLAVALQVSA